MGIGRMSYFLLSIFLSFLLLQRPTSASKQSYIVYLGGHSHSPSEASPITDQHAADSHFRLLGSILGGEEKARDAIFHSYTKAINGFAANLEEEEAMAIKNHPSVISVFPNRVRKLHTTRSWGFLGLERDGWTKARFGVDTVIANIDTGVWPESESFQDEGMGPVPPHWRGTCHNGTDNEFKCNRKLIGARFYNKGYRAAGGLVSDSPDSPRDVNGHGSHTLSTAAGRFVPGASLYGHAYGTAKGGSPSARVATYKVCWPILSDGGECLDADIMAGFDAAIHDGVHVISVSLGGGADAYFNDGIAIGSFHAVRHGITVVCSAGNSGPFMATVTNTAPWIITVAASTIDRAFSSHIILDDGQKFEGQSLSMSLPSQQFYPMISSKDANAANASRQDSKLCLSGSLDPNKVRGKIVVCLRGGNLRMTKGEVVRQAGGAGMVIANNITQGDELIAEAHYLPTIHISYSDGLALFSYLNSTTNSPSGSPSGYIRHQTELDVLPSPQMAEFSSVGPNLVNNEILKPDITAPGVSILAAFTGAQPPTDDAEDTRRVPFQMESGTSMSCPHVSGIAGLLKTLHPDWSPSAIKSAIMTTARTRDNMHEPIQSATPFNYGSGHIRPNHAMDPGLVYDVTSNDYLDFLCALGYNSTQLETLGIQPHSCPSKPLKLIDFNYPSITIPNLWDPTTVKRTLKNVGSPGTYRVRVEAPAGISVEVKPASLTFEKMGEEREFEVTLKNKDDSYGDLYYGRLTWSDGKHFVRSPIVVMMKVKE